MIEVSRFDIVHLLSVTRNHHYILSQMADRKANILITASALILTASVHFLFDPQLKFVAATLCLFALASLILAVLTTMPGTSLRVKRRPLGADDPSRNLLFFGDFVDLSWDEYRDGVAAILETPATVYERQLREIYVLGQGLQRRKYKRLRLAYMVFLAGTVCTTIVALQQAFLVERI